MKQVALRKLENLLPWLGPCLIVVVWQLLTMNGVVSRRVLPEPWLVLKATWKLVLSGELAHHAWVSSKRAALGFIIGGSAGFVLGFVNGTWKWADRAFDTPVQMLRNIPHLALIPLVILWFGLGEQAKVFLVALGVLFPVYVNTLHGVRSVDRGLIEMARIYGLSRRELYTEVILPSALPSILVGVRFALGIMWLSLIVGETIACDAGIGYLAMNAREFMQTDIVVLSIVLYASLGKLADMVARYLERRWVSWNSNLAAGAALSAAN